MTGFPACLYHATRLASFESILQEGLLADRYGEVHGAMDYAPAGPSVYLSAKLLSGNLNTALFDSGPVILLKIDTAALDPDLAYPDDLLMYMLDEEFLVECEGPEDLDRETIEEFADRFGMERDKAERILTAALQAGDDAAYPAILKEMWPEYLKTEGEIAYLGDVPATAIVGWRFYPQPDSDPQP